MGAVTLVLWVIVTPDPIEPVALGLATLLVELPYPLEALDVVIRTCEFDVPAVPVPLFRICQLTLSDPPATTLLGLRDTFNGCTSTVVAGAVTEKAAETAKSLLSFVWLSALLLSAITQT